MATGKINRRPVYSHQKIITAAFILAAWIFAGVILRVGFDFATSYFPGLLFLLGPSQAGTVAVILIEAFVASGAGLVFGGILAWSLVDMIPDAEPEIMHILSVSIAWMLLFALARVLPSIAVYVTAAILPPLWLFRYVIEGNHLLTAFLSASAGGAVGILLTIEWHPSLRTVTGGNQGLKLVATWSLAMFLFIILPILMIESAPPWYLAGDTAPDVRRGFSLLGAAVGAVAWLVCGPMTVSQIASSFDAKEEDWSGA